MKKRLIVTMLALVLLVAVLAAVKTMQIGAMIDQGKKFVPPPETVTAAEVGSESWEERIERHRHADGGSRGHRSR